MNPKENTIKTTTTAFRNDIGEFLRKIFVAAPCLLVPAGFVYGIVEGQVTSTKVTAVIASANGLGVMSKRRISAGHWGMPQMPRSHNMQRVALWNSAAPAEF
jgi:hypothetical protein